MPGEAYVQYILNQLDKVEIHGSENMKHMMNAIHMLEILRDDIVAHKKEPGEEPETDGK